MSDTAAVQSPNSNKTVGSVGGGAAGLGLGTGLVALISLRYPNMSPIEASAIGGFITMALGSAGTFLAPLLTAAQHRAIKALDGSASPDEKEILTVGKAQAIVAAAQGSPAPATAKSNSQS